MNDFIKIANMVSTGVIIVSILIIIYVLKHLGM